MATKKNLKRTGASGVDKYIANTPKKVQGKLTVNGTDFGAKAVVNWNGAAQTTTVVSGNQLTMAVPAAAIATSGTITVTVTNPATPGTGLYGSGGTMAATSSPMNFTVN